MSAVSQKVLDGRVELWTFPVSDAPPSASVFGTLSAVERARSERLVQTHKRHRYVHARARLREILSHCVAESASRLAIDYGATGKPYLPEHPELSFNLSHSADRGAVAVSRGLRVGVDIEVAHRDRPFQKLARRFFAVEEQTWVEAGGAAHRAERFYSVWTNKEAYVKALGLGLSLSPKRYALAFEVPDAPTLLRSAAPGAGVDRWMFSTLPATSDPFTLSVCVESR